MHAPTESTASRILLGCAKSELSSAMAAENPCHSPPWRRRRAYAERFGVRRHILSARHQLRARESGIAPHGATLSDVPAAGCGASSGRVLESHGARVPALNGKAMEPRAGKPYVERSPEDGLPQAGAIVRRPLAHVAGNGPQRARHAARPGCKQ